MSVSLYKYTPACSGKPCPGDCDLCDDVLVIERDIDWHLEHKKMGFYDPIAELYETLFGLAEEEEP